MRGLLVLLMFVTANISQAQIKNGFSAAEMRYMADQNAFLAENNFAASLAPGSFGRSSVNNGLLGTSDVRAFAEYEDTGYLIFSSATPYASKKAKETMAKQLPAGVKLIVYTGSTSQSAARRLKKQYADIVGEDRVNIVYMPGGEKGFWARDGVPVPVIRAMKNTATNPFLTLVDAKYYHSFEADVEFGSLFKSDVTRHKYFFEGGNFIANDRNECLVVNTNATAKVPDQVFVHHYGCEKLIRLPFVKGIGHADESVKFIDANTVLTDEESYVSILEDKGYEVVKIRRPKRKYETYVNSLMINGTVYVPIFRQPGDDEALQVYRDLGFQNVVGIESIQLSNNGLGSLHCITMTYPPVEMSELLTSMGGSILQ